MDLNSDPVQLHFEHIGDECLVSPAVADHGDEVEIPVKDDEDGATAFGVEYTVGASGE
jgi:hypothetical protein